MTLLTHAPGRVCLPLSATTFRSHLSSKAKLGISSLWGSLFCPALPRVISSTSKHILLCCLDPESHPACCPIPYTGICMRGKPGFYGLGVQSKACPTLFYMMSFLGKNGKWDPVRAS